MSGRWAIIKEAFDTAADADGETRARVLASLDSDLATREELVALLEAHDRRTLLDESEAVLERAGPFLLRERLGSGGFGDVYRGEQTSPVVREAAIKVLHGTHRARAVLARFSLEQDTLARLDHPCIAKLYEAGIGGAAGGIGGARPWFAMQLVRGERIDRWAADASARDIARLMAGIADAVHHAHQRGVIHRDIKPSNILVEQTESGPMARLIDFGVAKALDADGAGGVTVEQVRIGTPAYMSPEQREGGVIGVRSDVFALGAVLYDLLARRAREGPAPDRSESFSGGHEKRIARALEPVVRKAMAESADQRYPTAGELAADLLAACAGEPTTVGHLPLPQRVRWAVRRRPVAWGAGAVVCVALLGGIAGAGYGLVVAWRERDAASLAAKSADRQRASAEAALSILEETLTGIDPDIARGRDTTLMLDRARNALVQLDARQLSEQPEVDTRLRVIVGNAMVKLGLATEAAPVLSSALATARERLGLGNVVTREATTAWIDCLLQLGRYADAIAAVDETVLTSSLPGVEASQRERLAAIYERQTWSLTFLLAGNTQRAAEFNGASLELIATLKEPCSQAECMVFLHASEVALAVGNVDAAIEHAERALAVAKQAHKPPHPALARAHNNLGTCLDESGRTEEALLHKQAALEMARELFPPVDARTALAMNNVSITLAKIGRRDQAGPLMDEALAMFRALYPGKDHPDLARALDHSAVRFAVEKNFTKAEALAREALAMRQRLAPAGDDDVARTLVTLARVLAVAGRIDESVPLFKEAVQLRRRLADGKDSHEVARLLATCGEVLQEAGRVSEAEPLLAEALEMGLRLYPLDKGVHPEVAEWANLLIDGLRTQGKNDQAEALVRRFKVAN